MTRKIFILILIIIIAYIYKLPTEFLSVAGIGKIGGIISAILGILYLTNFMLVLIIAHFKNLYVKKILRHISRKDKAWKNHKILQEIKNCFQKVQEASISLNHDLAKEFTTNHFYKDHKAQLYLIKRQRQINMLNNMKIHRIEFIEIHDFDDNEQDGFSALISGSMRDFKLYETTRDYIEGSIDSLTFNEVWHFQRQGNKFVVSEILDRVHFMDLINLNSMY